MDGLKREKLIWVGVMILFGSILFIDCREGKDSSASSPEEKAVQAETLRPEMSFPGRIVFQSDMDGDKEIYLLTSKGLAQLTDNSWDDIYPRWSPDGSKVAYASNPNGNFDIFIMDADGGDPVRLTDSPQEETDLAWFPDGKRLLYSEEEKKGLIRQSCLWVLDLETKRKEKLIPHFSRTNFLADPSPRASLVAFTGKKLMGWDVFLLDMENGTTRDLVEGGKSCRPRFSPDGRAIVYVSSQADGKGDIWVMAWDGSGQQRVTERNETYDYFPSWSPDGRQVVFCSNLKSGYADQGEWALFIVDVATKKIQPLFDSSGRDVFPDWTR